MKKNIAESYKKGLVETTSFFKYPYRPDWNEVAQMVLSDARGSGIIDELIAQNAASASPRVQTNLKKLTHRNTAVVITGQQLGLLISPLYTIYKIITTLKLAEKLEADFPDYHFVPVFWLEGEDHDFAEINHFQILGKNGQVQALTLDDGLNDRMPTWRRVIPPEISTLLETVAEQLQPTEFTPEILEQLRRHYQPGVSWLTAFRGFLNWLFDSYGLLCFDPTTEGVKQASLPFVQTLIEKNNSMLEAFALQTDIITEKDYPVQVNVQPDYAYLFLSDPQQGRQPLFRREETFYLKDDGSFTADQLGEYFSKHPRHFSSTVLTRPIWQSWLLPVVSYVGGPAEISYWAQLKKAFGVFNLTMPHLSPRNSLTIIDARIRRFIDKYHIDPDSIDPDENRFLRKSIMDQEQFGDVSQNFSAMDKSLRENQQRMETALTNIDPTLVPLLGKTIGNMQNTLKKFENRVSKRIEEINQLMNRQLMQVHNALLPLGKRQERVLSHIYFLNKFGRKWLDDLIKKIDPLNPDHQFFEL